MEHFGITDIEIWDYISKNTSIDKILKVEVWMDSLDFDESGFCQLAMIHKLLGGIEVTYDFEIARKRLVRTIKTKKMYVK